MKQYGLAPKNQQKVNRTIAKNTFKQYLSAEVEIFYKKHCRIYEPQYKKSCQNTVKSSNKQYNPAKKKSKILEIRQLITSKNRKSYESGVM